MRRFRQIIESSTPVPTDSLWVKDGELYYHTNGEWKKFTDRDNANETYPYFMEGNTSEAWAHNLEVCASLPLLRTVTVKLGNKYGIYYGGKIVVLDSTESSAASILVYDVNFNTGELYETEYRVARSMTHRSLWIGPDNNTIHHNYIELIRTIDNHDVGLTDNFPVKINGAVGTGTWNPNDGGEATVLLPDGSFKHYTIDTLGGVSE